MTDTPADDDDKRARFRVIDNTPPSEEQAPPLTSSNDDGPADDAAQAALKAKLAALEEEHRELDQAIVAMEERMPYDRLTIQRLKKRKLGLKDQITALHARILPDIIA